MSERIRRPLYLRKPCSKSRYPMATVMAGMSERSRRPLYLKEGSNGIPCKERSWRPPYLQEGS